MRLYDVSVREVDAGWEHAVLGLLGDLTSVRRFDPNAPVLRAVPEHDRRWLERRFAERRAKLRFEPVGELRYRIDSGRWPGGDATLDVIAWQGDALRESGGRGQRERQQRFGSAAEARAAFEARCTELERAGVALADDSLSLLQAHNAREPALEAAIASAATRAERDAATEVYGDWLAQQGDPRGELALLQRAAERSADVDERLRLRRQADAHLERYRERLFGPLHWEQLLDGVTLGWSAGFVTRVHIVADRPPRALFRLLGVLFALPVACALRELSVEPGAQQKLVDALLELDCPTTVERLVLGGSEPEPYGMGNIERLDTLLSRLPALRSLQLRGEATGELALELPALERLRIDARYVGRVVESLAGAHCPHLRELDVRVRFFTASAAARVLRLIDAPPPSLESLSLRGVDALEPIARAIIAGPLAQRLRQLTLVASQPAPQAMAYLGEHAAALAALESLRLAPLDDADRSALGPLAERLVVEDAQ